jgi:hypothetical protein
LVDGALPFLDRLSDEAEEWRQRAGLTSGFDSDKNLESRARQMEYREVKPYVWRVMIAVGVGYF